MLLVTASVFFWKIQARLGPHYRLVGLDHFLLLLNLRLAAKVVASPITHLGVGLYLREEEGGLLVLDVGWLRGGWGIGQPRGGLAVGLHQMCLGGGLR